MMDRNVFWWRSSLKGQTTRRWAFYTLGAFMCPMDTGKPHGPRCPHGGIYSVEAWRKACALPSRRR